MSERDINKYPFQTANGLDLATKEFYELKGIPMVFWLLPDGSVRVEVEVWKSESDFANSESPLESWKWSYTLTDADKTAHSATIIALKNGALDWLKVGSDYQIRTLSINLQQTLITASAFETADPNFEKFGKTNGNFDEVVAENPDLVTAYSTLIWTLAKENNEVFNHFN